MSELFEVLSKDMCGRVGRLYTRTGVMETPAFLPVVDPVGQTIPPDSMLRNFACQAVITNSYLLFKNRREDATRLGVHSLIGFDKVVATDSGGYQILQYGEINIDPLEIAVFQEKIGSDISIPLDIPTGLVGEDKARETVQRTIDNAARTLQHVGHKSLWVGPIQGGTHLELLSECAKTMTSFPFDLFALGSPTPLLERYRFDKVSLMIATIKNIIPPEKPLHLFGAGHPMMFALAVALGCDLFDSASYQLYAERERYMTTTGTHNLADLKHLPCECRICTTHTARELATSPKSERHKLLSFHNLSMCFSEIRRVKQAIVEGRLLELVQSRANSHPHLLDAVRNVLLSDSSADLLVKNTPVAKKKSISFTDGAMLRRPEVRRYLQQLERNYSRPQELDVLVMMRLGRGMKHAKHSALSKLLDANKIDRIRLHFCFYDTPFAVIPSELKDMHPVSDSHYSEASLSDDYPWLAQEMASYTERNNYSYVIIMLDRTQSSVELTKLFLEKTRAAKVNVYETGPS